MPKYKPVECACVGDVLEALKHLPKDMRCKVSLADTVDIVVFNEGRPDEFLSFEDGGDWTRPDDFEEDED